MYKQLQRMRALAADRLLSDISIHSAALAKVRYSKHSEALNHRCFAFRTLCLDYLTENYPVTKHSIEHIAD